MKLQEFILFMVLLIILVTISSFSFAQEKCTGVYGNGPSKFSLATGSPGELGILKVLGESFSKEMHATLCWIKAGSGDSLKFLKEKTVDMIMVHAPDAEKKAVADKWAARKYEE